MYTLISNGLPTIGEDYTTELKTKKENLIELYLRYEIVPDQVIDKFIKIHDGYICRIYLHILLAHGKDLHDIYGPLRHISNQGCEVANGRDSKAHYQNTARGGESVIRKRCNERKEIGNSQT
eukprot:TRINITY_DN28181_c0_g1_i1.p2 TRINITY_DN28181_c0_g1~~TRINITY_DN28181_c0_g1_i1.p2  ORF type:complete len:122 (+),score=4.24 TRINITY_DN28181_c0_g1_i1:209-574(+)